MRIFSNLNLPVAYHRGSKTEIETYIRHESTINQQSTILSVYPTICFSQQYTTQTAEIF